MQLWRQSHYRTVISPSAFQLSPSARRTVGNTGAIPFESQCSITGHSARTHTMLVYLGDQHNFQSIY
ncbi:unnamed protein product, partial [Nesidiocoris tenuis]